MTRTLYLGIYWVGSALPISLPGFVDSSGFAVSLLKLLTNQKKVASLLHVKKYTEAVMTQLNTI